MIYIDHIHTKSLFKTGKTESIQTAPDHPSPYNLLHPDESNLVTGWLYNSEIETEM